MKLNILKSARILLYVLRFLQGSNKMFSKNYLEAKPRFKPSKRIRLAIVLAGPIYPDVTGGSVILASRLARGLSKKEVEVHVIAKRGFNFKSGYNNGIYHHAYVRPEVPIIRFFIAWCKILRKLFEIRPDICLGISFESSPACYFYSLVSNKPSLILFVGYDYVIIDLLSKFKILKFFRFRFSIAHFVFLPLFIFFKKRLHFITRSKKMYDNLKKFVDASKVHLASNPVDEEFFSLNPNIQGNNLVFVGRLAHEKGVDVLIKAFAKVSQRALPAKPKLIIVGDGPERPFLEKLINNSGMNDDVIITGLVPYCDVPKYLAKASLFVLPSRFEGTPNALLQAMAAGLPIVATNVGGIPDLIDERVDGILVPPEDVVALSKAIEYLLVNKDVAIKFSENVRRKAFKFKMDNIVEQYIKLFEEFTSKSS